MTQAPAFTLVELLVVITILVVLLALLVPAMDQAVYQAELAVCGTRLHGIAGGAIAYAMGNSRRYPDRASGRAGTAWHPAVIYNGNEAMNAAFAAGNPSRGANSLDEQDDRPILRQFLSLNGHLNDPLAGKLDFENLDSDGHAYASYVLWFGFAYQGRQGMMKVGDRFEGRGHDNVVRRFDLLASDRDLMQVANTRRTQTGHPDAAGITVNRVVQNGQFDLEVTGTGADSLKMTIATWASLVPRGTVDLNFAHQDGSVRRYQAVKFFDSSMNTVPDLSDSRFDWFATVPPENR